jgi:hypothetical protein
LTVGFSDRDQAPPLPVVTEPTAVHPVAGRRFSIVSTAPARPVSPAVRRVPVKVTGLPVSTMATGAASTDVVPVSVIAPGALVPTRLTARTLHGVRHTGRQTRQDGRSVLAVRGAGPPGQPLIVKPVIGTPSAPSAGAAQVTVAMSGPEPDPVTAVGAAGSAASAIVQVKECRRQG